jgi:two-component system, LytTR family, response regulator
MIKIGIIDDEIKSILILRKLLIDHCPEIELVLEATGIKEGYAAIREKQPQLIFLDIEMSDGTGFDLLRQFDSPNFYVIFVTAHTDYAIKAFKFSAVDYILKPIDVDDLINAVEKATAIIKKGNLGDSREIPFLNIRTKQGSVYIKPETIIRIQAENSYSRIFINDGQNYMLSYNLGSVEDKLDKNMFIRIHKSDIININYLKSFHNTGELFIEMTDGSTVRVSRRSKKLLEERLNQKL